MIPDPQHLTEVAEEFQPFRNKKTHLLQTICLQTLALGRVTLPLSTNYRSDRNKARFYQTDQSVKSILGFV